METFVPKGNVHGPILPEFILKKQITFGAKIMYALLCDYASSDDYCWPAHATLAGRLSCSVTSVKKYLTELVNEKLIDIRRGQYHYSNDYYLLRPASLNVREAKADHIQPKAVRQQPESDRTQPKVGYINTLKNQEERKDPPLPPVSAPRNLPPAPRSCRLGGGDSFFHDFEKAWEAYPKKQAMGFARFAWLQLRRSGQLPPLDKLLSSITQFMATSSWQCQEGRFIPQMSNWLRGQRWLDTPSPADAAAIRQQEEISAHQRKQEALEAERKAKNEKLRPQFEAFAARFKQPYHEPMAFGIWMYLRSAYRAPQPSDVPDDNALNITAFLDLFKRKCGEAAYRAAHPTIVSPSQDIFKTERAGKPMICGEIASGFLARLLPQRESLCAAV